MKVLLVGPDRSVKGGITTVIDGILSSDLAKDHEFLHLSSHRDDLSKLGKLLYGIKSYRRFKSTVRIFKPDVVHIHSSFGASFFRKAVFMFLARRMGLKSINHIHGAEFDAFYTNASDRKKSLVATVYDLPQATIVLSKEWQERISAICKRSKVFCLNNFAKLPDAESMSEVAAYSGREPIVLFLGEVGKRKGAYDLPAIAKRVVASVPSVKFVVAGNGEIDEVRALAAENGVSSNLIFAGWIGPDEKKNYCWNPKSIFFPHITRGCRCLS